MIGRFADKPVDIDLMTQESLEQIWCSRQHAVVIFDRGVPDVIGYLRLCGLPVPAPVEKAANLFRYNARVFIAPPWREIFAADSERKQEFAEARATHAAMVEVYTALGYELTPLPLASVPERVRFVRAHIAGT